MEQPPKEVCTIRIVFPVVTDEQAIVVKKKIADILKAVDSAQIHFSLMSMRNGVDIRPTNQPAMG